MDTRVQRISLRMAARALADLVMPRTCVVCDRDLILQEEHICVGCLADLPLTYYESLARNPMSERVNAVLERDATEYQPYVQACALFFYTGPYRHISPQLKYGRRFGDGRFFARMLGEKLAGSELYRDVDCVIPVPLHPRRRWRRGYNQAEIIAREVARCLPAARMDARALRRRRRTRTQIRLGSDAKWRNVADAFALRRGAPAGWHLLVVDDVCTTGATLAACIRALRAVLPGDVKISTATLAVVGNS